MYGNLILIFILIQQSISVRGFFNLRSEKNLKENCIGIKNKEIRKKCYKISEYHRAFSQKMAAQGNITYDRRLKKTNLACPSFDEVQNSNENRLRSLSPWTLVINYDRRRYVRHRAACFLKST